MSVTIDLTQEREERLQLEARRRGLSLQDYLKGALLGEYPLPPPKRTPAEALKAWHEEGITPMWLDRPEDSPELARKLRYGNLHGEGE
jgi:hypothetical protein